MSSHFCHGLCYNGMVVLCCNLWPQCWLKWYYNRYNSHLFQCVKQSNSIPISTLQIIKDHPEMKEWIHPIQKDTPFFTSNKNFTKIAVDRVQASDESIYSVLLLATGIQCIGSKCLLCDFLHTRDNNTTSEKRNPSLITCFCSVFFSHWSLLITLIKDFCTKKRPCAEMFINLSHSFMTMESLKMIGLCRAVGATHNQKPQSFWTPEAVLSSETNWNITLWEYSK